MAVSSNNGGGRVLGLMCVKWNGVGSNLAVHFNFFFPCLSFPKFWQFIFALDCIYFMIAIII